MILLLISNRDYFNNLASLHLLSMQHAIFLEIPSMKNLHQKKFELKWTLNSDFLPFDPRAIKKDNSITWSESLISTVFHVKNQAEIQKTKE